MYRGGFFQAEDGIRDRSPSRGLGDVYKRQMPYLVKDESGNWLKNSELKVFDKSYEELSKYNIGGLDPESKHGKRFKEQKLLKNAKIPKLSELLELASRKENKDVFLNLEVKSTSFIFLSAIQFPEASLTKSGFNR